MSLFVKRSINLLIIINNNKKSFDGGFGITKVPKKGGNKAAFIETKTQKGEPLHHRGRAAFIPQPARNKQSKRNGCV
jgi:hypothetical protein